MESVFVIGLGCVAWTAIELFRLTSCAPTIATPAGAQSNGHASPTRKPGARGARAAQAPRFTAWDDRGRRIVVEDLGRA